MRELYGLTRDFRRSWNASESTLASLLADAIRSRVRFTNVQMCFADDEEEGMLCRPELEVLMDVVLTYLDENSQALGAPDYGTLTIYSQQIVSSQRVDDFDPLTSTLCLLLADLKSGPCRIPQEGALPDKVSREEVCSAAKAALAYKAGVAKTRTPAFLCNAKVEDAKLRSGIYFDERHYGVRGADSRIALVLNCDKGRLAASFCCSGMLGDFELLGVIAQTLAGLKPHDVKLQKSVQMVRKQMDDENPRYGGVMEAVKRMFVDGTDPLLKPWQDWRHETF